MKTAIIIIRFFFRDTVESSKKWPYQRQLIISLLTIAGMFLAIGSLPLEQESKNQILAVMGILLSAIIALSSTTLVGNMMAGIMLRMMGEFRGGDFIEVDNIIGRVTNLGIFHTEIQQVNRDMVSLPNLLLVQNKVKITRRDGTFINIAVSIGFSTDYTIVEEALKEAAISCSLTDPFVFIEAFLDNAICYRLYGLLNQPNERLSKSSELHKAVLHTMSVKGIEIASPSLIDRREFNKEEQYIPILQKKNAIKSDDLVIEEKVFDKAEEAQSIEDLKQKKITLGKKVEKIKGSNNKDTKKIWEAEIKEVTEKIAEKKKQQKEEA